MTSTTSPPETSSSDRRLATVWIVSLSAVIIAALVVIAVTLATGRNSGSSSPAQSGTYASAQEMADRLASTDMACVTYAKSVITPPGALESGTCELPGDLQMYLTVYPDAQQVAAKLAFIQEAVETGLVTRDVAGGNWIADVPPENPSWAPRVQAILGGKLYNFGA